MENTELLQQILAAIKQGNDALRAELLGEMQRSLETLKAEMQTSQETLKAEMQRSQETLKAEMQTSQETLKAEMQRSQEMLKKDIIDQIVDAMNIQSEMLVKTIDKRVTEAETRINVKIEHEIDHHLQALHDGYKLNHEKNKRQDARLHNLDGRVERLEVRMDVLEHHKTV